MRRGEAAPSETAGDVAASTDLYRSARTSLREFIARLCERWSAQTGEK